MQFYISEKKRKKDTAINKESETTSARWLAGRTRITRAPGHVPTLAEVRNVNEEERKKEEKKKNTRAMSQLWQKSEM